MSGPENRSGGAGHATRTDQAADSAPASGAGRFQAARIATLEGRIEAQAREHALSVASGLFSARDGLDRIKGPDDPAAAEWLRYAARGHLSDVGR